MLQKKVCILGPTGVGKTSLIKRFVDGVFSEKYLTSIGVKVDKKLVSSSFTPVQLILWDLEGIDKYCGFNPRYLRGAQAIIFVVDQTRFSSLAELMEIYALAREHSQAPAVLVINKTDLPPAISWDDSIVQTHSTSFEKLFLTSAKTGKSVEDVFESVAELVTV
ncbi:Rab family GTPase [Glaciecola siphonariae]|uniref:Rab family GTPase n=1 Tax=Glaciecola siphonariae TaxID=521012 RepID=A0ABV9LV75_9ALTE